MKGVSVSPILFPLERSVKCTVRKIRRQTRDKALATRCQVILLAHQRHRRVDIATATEFSISWVQRILKRFRERGVPSLFDGREDNGQTKLEEAFLRKLYAVVDRTPQEYGYPRPTWTQELLCKVMHERTGVKVSTATMSRALTAIGARHGRPKPTVGCPWKASARRRRQRQLQRLRQCLPEDQVLYYEDEIDIHLNPKIGPDWMNRGRQKRVMTPGQNQKRYLAGAMDARSGQLLWRESDRKNTALFVDLLKHLVQANPQARIIHLILDNFRIHGSKAAQAAVASWHGKVRLHFLPPYCPDDNRIERAWLDVHANVTRNHRCRSMQELMTAVARYLDMRNARNLEIQPQRGAA